MSDPQRPFASRPLWHTYTGIALPIYVTLVVTWIDRRLEGRMGRSPNRDGD